MKLFVVGAEPILLTALKESGYEAVRYDGLPLPELVQDQVLMVTSEIVEFGNLPKWREQYPSADLIYLYEERGISGWYAVALLCQKLDIKFIRPLIGVENMLHQLDGWYKAPDDPLNVIGVFGVLPGVGTTTVAATLAQTYTRAGKKVMMLGLNVYNPGWEEEAPVTLDRWRQRLIARILQPEDFSQLVSVQGFTYLPGNQDALGALDFTEEEITYLLREASHQADVVIADFGAIPESAAWVTGLQRSAYRIMVAAPRQSIRLKVLMHLCKDLDVPPAHWMLIANRAGVDDISLRALATAVDMQPLFSFGDKGILREWTLPLAKKEQQEWEKAVLPLIGGGSVVLA